MSDSAKSFEAIALPHLPAAYNLARWLLRDPQSADDVVQEAYLRAFRFFHDLRNEDARPWLLGIVRNACYDWMRQQQRLDGRIGFDEETGGSEALDGLAAPTADPAMQYEHHHQRQRVNAAIAALAPAFREMIVLRELEEMSYEEVARVAGIPVGTVMSRLSRARSMLRKLLQGEVPSDPRTSRRHHGHT